MTISQNNDHAGDAIGKLLAQFKDKPNLEALITAYIEQIQELEGVAIGLHNLLDLDQATGAALDRIGGIVGEPRNNYTDEEYRINIRARIKINRSNGTATDILSLIEFLVGSAENVTYARQPSGSGGGNFLLQINEDLSGSNVSLDLLLFFICQAVQGGASFVTELDVTANPWIWGTSVWGGTDLWGGAIEISECISPQDGGYPVTIANDIVPPVVTVNYLSGSADNSGGNIIFQVTYSDETALFSPTTLELEDLEVGGTAADGAAILITGTNPFDVTVGGFSSGGTVNLTVKQGAAVDTAGNPSDAVTSADQPVADVIVPIVAVVPGADGFLGGSNSIDFTVTFTDETAMDPGLTLTAGELTVGGTAVGGTVSSITGTNPFTVTIDSFTSAGTVNLTVAAGAGADTSGNLTLETPSLSDGTIQDDVAPLVFVTPGTPAEIGGVEQMDYTVLVTDETGLAMPVDLLTGDVSVGGTSTGTTIQGITGSNPFTVTVENFSTVGTHNLTVNALVFSDNAGNFNAATTSADSNIVSAEAFVVFRDDPLIINGTTMTRTVAFQGADASDGGWPSYTGGITAVLTGTNNSGTMVLSGDPPVQGMFYQQNPADSWFRAVGQQGLLDVAANEGFVFEIIWRPANTGNNWHLSGADSTALEGLILRQTSRLVGSFRNSGGNIQLINNQTLVAGTWYYMAMAVDRNGNYLVYNGQKGSTLDGSGTHTLVGAVTNSSSELDIAGGSTAVESQGDHAWVAFYKAVGLDLSNQTAFTNAFNARYTLLGQTPGSPMA